MIRFSLKLQKPGIKCVSLLFFGLYLYEFSFLLQCVSLKHFRCNPVIQLIYLLNRGGRGGGYKELDEEELEEIKRRRREAEEVRSIGILC